MRTYEQDLVGHKRRINGLITASGAISAGIGFSCIRTGTGIYQIHFNEPFASSPSVIVSSAQGGPYVGIVTNYFSDYCVVTIFSATSGNPNVDAWFSFVAEGRARI
jgi:hypothetical protein